MYYVIDTGSAQGHELARRGNLLAALNEARRIAPTNGRPVEVWSEDSEWVTHSVGIDGEVQRFPRGSAGPDDETIGQYEKRTGIRLAAKTI